MRLNLTGTATLYNFISKLMNMCHINIINTIYVEFSIKGKYRVIEQTAYFENKNIDSRDGESLAYKLNSFPCVFLRRNKPHSFYNVVVHLFLKYPGN